MCRDVPLLCRTISFTYAGGDLSAENATIKPSTPHKTTGFLSNFATSTPNTSNKSQTSGSSSEPCDSSNGFQNTLVVLERHVKQRRLWLKVDPDATTEEPSSLELQLMVIERLKSLSESTRLAWFLMNYIIFTDINNGLKREQKQENIEKLARNLKSDTNDCLYHIAREKSGLLYLKVVKSPQQERGNNDFCVFVFIFCIFFGFYN